MKQLISKLTIRKRSVIVDEEHLLTILSIFNCRGLIKNFHIEKPTDIKSTRWIIHIYTSDYKWLILLSRLSMDDFNAILEYNHKIYYFDKY